MASTTDKSTSAKRFELPKLNFDFSSLTDGTDIPPPPESPVEKVPTLPKTPTAAGKKQGDAAKDNNKANGATGGSQAANGSSVSESETQSTNGGGGRPVSRSDGSVLDEKKAKRSSGFFRRLRTGDAAKRSSTVYEDPARSQSKPEIRGPPAPMIPELSALQSKLDVNDSGSLGDDLFKDIK